ncbi:hypothetical protein [Niabella ginsengisoli]|uniref:Uncharacterized protein n=1 Tax=Niabella ginsengisoli TaxID=522298 RepID=A0ABS9SFJ9_9BACT|nr:hypothetical protein [Niabella ginsengisoli]MCH5597096.1 hypothetical protein [Niabella ginsengisoli]
MTKYFKYILFSLLLLNVAVYCHAQNADTIRVPPMPSMEEIKKDWGPNDQTKIGAIWYGTDYNSFKVLPYTEEENVWISKLPQLSWNK